MSAVDEFYPMSTSMQKGGMWMVGYTIKIMAHLRNARNGDMVAESKLCNRIGQLRRHFPDGIPDHVREQVVEAVDYLRSVGRVVKLRDPDPRMWISNRQGLPRW